MSLTEIYNDIKEAFCSLWTYKIRGNTIEVITPFSTPTSKFISVFITQRDDHYIVTDGGWLLSGEYYSLYEIEGQEFSNLLLYFESFYELKKTSQVGSTYFYKSTDKPDLIPNLVYDISQFISQILATASSQLNESVDEIKERENFRKSADNFLSGIINKQDIQFRESLGNDYESVRFNAIIRQGVSLSLIKYVTGSTPDIFKKSLTNATVDFEIANASLYRDFIRRRVAFINDQAQGYDPRRIYHYIKNLEQHTKMPGVFWSKKEDLFNILS